MRTKIMFWIQATMIALFSLLIVTNCTKDDDLTKTLVLTTTDVTEITQNTATSGGTISSDGGENVLKRGVCWSTDQNPTIADNKTTDGAGVGSFTSAISGLTANTTYYVRAYASNNAETVYGNAITFTTLNENGTSNGNSVFNPDITYGSMTDIEGNTYKTVIIGTQTWMAENLKVTKYNDNTDIINVTSDTWWEELDYGAYCNYDNLESNGEIYGRLYNYFVIETGKLAPEGWHVPTGDDWKTLINFLIANGYNYDGTTEGNKIAKTLASTTGWESDDDEVTVGGHSERNNSTGFSGIPSGVRYEGGSFHGIGTVSRYWTYIDNYNQSGPTSVGLRSTSSNFEQDYSYFVHRYGRSVRLVADNIPQVSTNVVTEITQTTAICAGNIISDGGAKITMRGVCWSTDQNPTITDNKTTDGAGAGSFTSAISGLTANTTYYVRAYATNNVGTGYGCEMSFTTMKKLITGTMTDIDGNTYKTVTIGTQTWMAENLKTTKYNDGTPIPNITDNKDWYSLSTGAYCNYDNLESNGEIYGRLYNFYAVNTGKLAPAGWHVPSDEEWTILENYLIANGYNYDGTKEGNKIAKSLASKTNWISCDKSGTPGNTPEKNNSTGFTALPGGYRSSLNGGYFGGWCIWWSSTLYYSSNAYYRYMKHDHEDLYRTKGYKEFGYYVRLVKD